MVAFIILKSQATKNKIGVKTESYAFRFIFRRLLWRYMNEHFYYRYKHTINSNRE